MGRFSIIMSYLVYGNLAYSNASNRNTALTNINNTLAGYGVENVAVNGFAAGVNTSGSTGLTISIRCSDAEVEALRVALKTAWTSGTRATTGHMISAVKE
jgi:hypothetical protein